MIMNVLHSCALIPYSLSLNDAFVLSSCMMATSVSESSEMRRDWIKRSTGGGCQWNQG